MTRAAYRSRRTRADPYQALLLAFAALALLAVLCAVSALARADVTGTQPPAGGEGDWTITVSTVAEGVNLRIDGDVTVLPGRTLELRQCVLELSGDAPHALIVWPGASLLAERTVLTTTMGSPPFTLEVRGSASLSGCDVSRVDGGIQAFADGLSVVGCRVHDCPGPAIELHGHSATVTGCTIFGVDVGVSSIAPEGNASVMATVDGWTFALADTTLAAKTYGVYLYWKKTMSGDLDLDFDTDISNVNITKSSKDGIYCYVDLLDSGGSGVLDSLFDLKVTGGLSNQNGGSGIYVFHQLKPASMSGKVTGAVSITLTSTKLDSNAEHGLNLQDTLYCDQGSSPTVNYKTDVSLDGCEVASNGKDGVHVERPRTLYYTYGTGDKTRAGTITLKDTTVKGNGAYGVYAYDSCYSYSSRGKLVWTNTINLRSATIESNKKDGLYDNLYETLYYGDRVGVDYRQYFDFQDSTIGRNGQNGFELLTSGYMYYHGEMSLRNEVKLLRCRIHNNTNLGGKADFQMYGYDWQYTFYRRGTFSIDTSRLEDNGDGGFWGRWGGWSYLAEFDVTGRVVGNRVHGNGADKGIGYEGMQGNKGEALATGNLFDHNGGGGGTTALDLVYFSQFVVYGNTFRNDTHRALVRCYAYAIPGPSPNVGPKYGDWVQIYENTFEDCGAGTGQGEGAAVIDSYYAAGSMLFVDNVLRRCDGNGVSGYHMYGSGTLYVKRNVFEAIGGSAVMLGGCAAGAKAEVTGNYMGNATGSPGSAFAQIQDDSGSTVTIKDNVAQLGSCSGVISTGGTGPRTLVVKGNRLVGLGGNAIDLLGQSFTVEGNNLSDCKGFAIALRGFTQLPIVGINTIARAENGLLLEAKERTDGKRLRILMDNVTWDVNGTAISTDHLDLVVSNSTLRGHRALVADDGTITTISTVVPYISGSTGPDGHIEVYYRLGLNLTWASASGVDSGLPAPDALVVFRRGTGGYYTSRIADRAGHTNPELFPSWMIVGGHVDKLSPYDLEITASGLTTHAQLRLEADQVASVKVVDWALPSISVEKPYSGALVNTPDLTVKGFLSERGSGLSGAWASTDGVNWTPVVPEEIWVVKFSGLHHGKAHIFAKAMDRSGNVNVTHVDFDVDLQGPALEVLRPLDRTHTRDSYIIVEATTERTAELFLDGAPVPNRQGSLFERMHLTQGLNIIVVEAVDGSGNAAISVLHVWLDTVPPALFVSSPRDGDVAAEAVVTVEGRTESTANVTINDLPVAVDPSGWFRVSYLLTSRENLLAISAKDEAGNENVSYVRVTLDDSPPEFTVLTPRDGTLTSATQVSVEGSVGQGDLGCAIYIDGERVDQVGRFTATVVLVEGENRIVVQAVDPNGRSSTETIRVVRDTTPPVIALLAPPSTDWITRQGTIVIAGSAPTASELLLGGSRVDLASDGSFNFTHQLEAGINSLELVAKDAAGNADTLVLRVVWDSSPPDLRVEQLPRSTRGETMLLNGTTDGLVVRVNGVPVPVVDGAFSVPVHLEPGANTFDVVSEDAAGNLASSQVSTDREGGGNVQVARGFDLDWMTLLPLIITVAALVATAVVLRRAPPPMAGQRNGRRRPNGAATPANGHAGAHVHESEIAPLIVDVPSQPRAEPFVPVPKVTAYAPEPPTSAPEPGPAITGGPKLELDFAPLPVYSVPDPAGAGVVDVGSNGEYSPHAPATYEPPAHLTAAGAAPKIWTPPETKTARRIVEEAAPKIWTPPETKTAGKRVVEHAPKLWTPPETKTAKKPVKEPAPKLWTPPETKTAKKPVKEPAPKLWTPIAVEPTPEPVVEPAPMLWSPPAPEPIPEPAVEPAPKLWSPPAPEPTPEPVEVPAPIIWTPLAAEPTPEPAMESAPKLWTPPAPEPAPEPAVEPTTKLWTPPAPEPAPEFAVEPAPKLWTPPTKIWTPPEPKTVPKPIDEPTTKPWTPPVPKPVPKAVAEPVLEPTPGPEPEPELDLELDLDSQPDTEEDGEPEVIPTPTPDADTSPEPETTSEDEPEPVSRLLARLTAVPRNGLEHGTAPRPAPAPEPRPVARPVPAPVSVRARETVMPPATPNGTEERPSPRVHQAPVPPTSVSEPEVFVAPVPPRPVPVKSAEPKPEVARSVHAPPNRPMVVKATAEAPRPSQPAQVPRRTYPTPTSSSVSKPHIKSKLFAREQPPAPREAPRAGPTTRPTVPKAEPNAKPKVEEAPVPAFSKGSKEAKVLDELLDELNMNGEDET